MEGPFRLVVGSIIDWVNVSDLGEGEFDRVRRGNGSNLGSSQNKEQEG